MYLYTESPETLPIATETKARDKKSPAAAQFFPPI